MLDRMKEILEIVVAAATLLGLIVHAVGADKKPWGQRVLHFSLDLVGFLKSFTKSGGGGATMVLLVALGLSAQACQYAKPACDVVKIADEACEVLLVTLPDGGAEPVPKSEIQQLAMRRQAVRRQTAPVDGGYGQ